MMSRPSAQYHRRAYCGRRVSEKADRRSSTVLGQYVFVSSVGNFKPIKNVHIGPGRQLLRWLRFGLKWVGVSKWFGNARNRYPVWRAGDGILNRTARRQRRTLFGDRDRIR